MGTRFLKRTKWKNDKGELMTEDVQYQTYDIARHAALNTATAVAHGNDRSFYVAVVPEEFTEGSGEIIYLKEEE